MIALKSGETIQLIIRAFESHNIGFYGLGATEHFLRLPPILFKTKGPEGGGSTGLTALMTRVVGFTALASNFASFADVSVSREWCTTTSVSSNDRFRDGAFPPTFFGAVAAEMVLRFRTP